jgi:hypothetical protein
MKAVIEAVGKVCTNHLPGGGFLDFGRGQFDWQRGASVCKLSESDDCNDIYAVAHHCASTRDAQ